MERPKREDYYTTAEGGQMIFNHHKYGFELEIYVNHLESLIEQQVKPSVEDVFERSPVCCTLENEKGELVNGARVDIEGAGIIITELSKKVKAFETFIDEFNEQYR